MTYEQVLMHLFLYCVLCARIAPKVDFGASFFVFLCFVCAYCIVPKVDFGAPSFFCFFLRKIFVLFLHRST